MAQELIDKINDKFSNKQASYMMVALLALLDVCSAEGVADIDEIVLRFNRFYEWRVENNKLAEKDSRLLKDIASLSSSIVKTEMLNKPIKHMGEFIDVQNGHNTLAIKPDIWLQLNEPTTLAAVKRLAYKHLYEYYKDIESVWLTVNDLEELPDLYPVKAHDVKMLSGLNMIKGIHPIEKDGQRSVIILCTLGGDNYPNEWLDVEHKLLKYYAEGKINQETGSKDYNLEIKANQYVINSKDEAYPIYVFTRNQKGDLFHYEGIFTFITYKQDDEDGVYFELKKTETFRNMHSIPDVPVEKIVEAMQRFDRELRNTPALLQWEAKANQKFALLFQGNKYPPKYIINLATGLDRSSFSGGYQSNSYLQKKGFEIISLGQPTLPAQDVEVSSEELSYKFLSERVSEYVSGHGFIYPSEFIKNILLSIKTKPFVIMAGISGTGKSKIGELLAEAMGATAKEGRYTLIPVRPDWNDSTDLIGYQNLQGEFVEGPLTKVIQRAKKDPNSPYFICLDEMNLARVEYYFSDFLSVIESRRFEGESIVTHPINIHGLKEPIYFPENLYLIGTVNMDETTHPFSKKVLDRANTIELAKVDLEKYPTQEVGFVERMSVPNSILRSDYLSLKDCYGDYKDFIHEQVKLLNELNAILSEHGFQVGYRVRDEFCFYLIYNKEWKLLSNDVAVDLQISQKILPRIQGSSADIETLLERLSAFFDNQYPSSKAKVGYMRGRFESDGFTSFWV